MSQKPTTKLIFLDGAILRGGALHLLGLLSNGSAHSHSDHIKAACELAAARGMKKDQTYATT